MRIAIEVAENKKWLYSDRMQITPAFGALFGSGGKVLQSSKCTRMVDLNLGFPTHSHPESPFLSESSPNPPGSRSQAIHFNLLSMLHNYSTLSRDLLHVDFRVSCILKNALLKNEGIRDFLSDIVVFWLAAKRAEFKEGLCIFLLGFLSVTQARKPDRKKKSWMRFFEYISAWYSVLQK